jgi:hypothetical protein
MSHEVSSFVGRTKNNISSFRQYFVRRRRGRAVRANEVQLLLPKRTLSVSASRTAGHFYEVLARNEVM